MLSDHSGRELRSALHQPFYVRTDHSDRAQLCDSQSDCPCNQLSMLNTQSYLKVLESSEIITANGIPKRLLIFSGYLIWLRHQTQEVPLSFESFPAMVVSEVWDAIISKMEGYHILRWSIIESNLSSERLTNDQLVASATNEGDQSLGFRRSLFFRLIKRDGHCKTQVETLVFANLDQQQLWRSYLASAHVFFTDFDVLYQIESRLPKIASWHSFKIRKSQTRELYIAKLLKLPGVADHTESAAVPTEISTYSCILEKVSELGVSPKFIEMYFSENSYISVEEFLPLVPFSDWFSSIWSLDLKYLSDEAQVLALLIELAQLVRDVHKLGISHGSIRKNCILVKTFENLNLKKPEALGGLASLKLWSKANTVQENVPCEGVTADPKTLRPQPSAQSRLPIPPGSVCSLGFIASPLCKAPLRRMYIVGFSSSSLDLKQLTSVLQSDRQKPTLVKKVELECIARNHEFGLAADILELGLIFYEVLFGLDVQAALALKYGVEYEFACELLAAPHHSMGLRMPLYILPTPVRELLIMMIHPNPKNRPTAEDCDKTLNQELAELLRPKISAFQATSRISRHENTGGIMSSGRLSVPWTPVARNLKLRRESLQSAGESLISQMAGGSVLEDRHSLLSSPKKPTISALALGKLDANRRRSAEICKKSQLSLIHGSSEASQLHAPTGGAISFAADSGIPKVETARKIRLTLLSRNSSCPLTNVCAAGRLLFKPENKPRKVVLSPRIPLAHLLPGKHADQAGGPIDHLVSSVFRGTFLQSSKAKDPSNVGFKSTEHKMRMEAETAGTSKPKVLVGGEGTPRLAIKLNRIDSM